MKKNEIAVLRYKIIKLIRNWFDEQGFLEVNTPRMVALPGQEPNLDPFWTEAVFLNRGLKKSLALITSPEYSMKKLLASGLDKIYDLGPCFRNNEPLDGVHDVEFLLLEWYRKETGLFDIMQDTEDLIYYLADNCIDSKLKLPKKFRRLTVQEAWKKYLDIDLEKYLNDRSSLAELAIKTFNQTVTDTDSWNDIYFKIFLSYIEPKLSLEPTFLYQYPLSMASLARKNDLNNHWADRVELYINGLELANGFAELDDIDEQRIRFKEEQRLRKKNGKKIWSFDDDFLDSLPKMGKASGIALGVDRLIMLLAGVQKIEDISLFSFQDKFKF